MAGEHLNRIQPFLVAIYVCSVFTPSQAWLDLGAVASSVKNAVQIVPNTIGNIHNSVENLFANRNPDNIVFEFSPSKGVIQIIDFRDPESVKKSDFNSSRPTTIITHGFTPDFKFLSGANTVFGSIADAYFDTGADYNLLAVNWEDLARPRGLLKPLHYPAIVKNVPIVAKRVAEFVVYLINNADLDVNNLHLIGFSLGAHVSGIAGDFVKNMTGKTVRRITGLDPASPEFYVPSTHVSERLDDTDAQFVVAIHTNVKANGIWYPVGHVDFYPNDGGPIQPACAFALQSPISYSLIYRLVCSHSQAYAYYAESIRNTYYACPCDAVSDLAGCEKAWDDAEGRCEAPLVFGDKCPETAPRGIYFLRFSDKVS